MYKIIVPIFLGLTFLCFSAMSETMSGNYFISSLPRAKFVLIPAGTFTMGSPEGESGRGAGETQRQVNISRPFYLQTTEVTQEQWKRVMGNNPSSFKHCGNDCPVERVTWKDVQKFISKLNSVDGTDKYRLPTAAEWEYVARAGSQSDRYGEIDDIAWYDANSSNKTHPVGQKRPNAWGFYDMLGNVGEWVHDWSGSSTVGSVTDPIGPSSGVSRVRLGGSWFSRAKDCRMANRLKRDPGYGDLSLGFRLARTP